MFKIKKNKKSRILCIFDNKKNVDKFKIFEPFFYKIDIYVIYYGNIYNPPFFNTIICTYNYINDESYIMLWNMVLTNGYLIIKKTHLSNILKLIKTDNYKDYDEEYLIFQKKSSITYIIYNNYRIIDFIIIGVQKGGTSAAMANLEKHPDISLYKDELHFYDRDWTKGVEWYKKHFDYSKKLVGEKNPNIIYLEHTFPMIQKINPMVKLILFLRNPIDRAYSAWYMFSTKYITNIENIKTFKEECMFELEHRLNEPANLRISNSHILQRGLYYK